MEFKGTINNKKATTGKQAWSLGSLILANGTYQTDAGGALRKPMKPKYQASRLAQCFTASEKKTKAVKPSAYILHQRIIGAITNHKTFKTMGGYNKLRKGFEADGFKSEYFKELLKAMEVYQEKKAELE